MKKLTKESRTFVTIWLNLFIVFILIAFMTPKNPIMTTSISTLYSIGSALLWATVISVFLYILYLFVELIANLFRKQNNNAS